MRKHRLESTISKSNNMKQMRAAAQKEPELVDAVLDSMSPVKIVVTDVIRRLCLKVTGQSSYGNYRAWMKKYDIQFAPFADSPVCSLLKVSTTK